MLLGPVLVAHPVPESPLWLTYPGGDGPGKGKHIVLIAAEQEYRGEQAMPMLAGVLSKHHGFDCTVLFGVNEKGLVDPTLPSETLLWRLFNEDGVRVFEPHALKAFCRCSEDRIATVIESFSPEEKAEMVEDDGKIRVTCEYCSRVYAIESGEVIELARAVCRDNGYADRVIFLEGMSTALALPERRQPARELLGAILRLPLHLLLRLREKAVQELPGPLQHQLAHTAQHVLVHGDELQVRLLVAST